MSSDLQRAQQLMMAALDDEISADEQRELDRMMEQDAALREEYKRMTLVKNATDKMSFRQPPAEVWDTYWDSVYNRLERGIGWVLFSVGSIVLIAYGLWEAVVEIFKDTDIPMALKASIYSLLLGLVILMVSVIREKLFTKKDDPYAGVKR